MGEARRLRRNPPKTLKRTSGADLTCGRPEGGLRDKKPLTRPTGSGLYGTPRGCSQRVAVSVPMPPLQLSSLPPSPSMVSFPSCPNSRSLPVPPIKTSFPPSPKSWSLPWLPNSRSSPALPQMTSLPPRPRIMSFPPRPWMTSLPGVPTRASFPKVPTMVAGRPLHAATWSNEKKERSAFAPNGELLAASIRSPIIKKLSLRALWPIVRARTSFPSTKNR